MSEETNEQFMDKVFAIVGKQEPFKPFAYYNRDGDCVEFFAKPDDYYAERVDGLLTVYRSSENDEIIGSLLKGIKYILDKYPGFLIEIHEDRIHLSHLLLASLWSKKHTENIKAVKRTYRHLIESAEETKIEAELILS